MHFFLFTAQILFHFRNSYTCFNQTQQFDSLMPYIVYAMWAMNAA